MKQYKLISFDMFQTLVDVNAQKEHVFRRIFGTNYSIDNSNKLWEEANLFVYSYFHKMNNNDVEFAPVVTVFEKCYSELFPKYGIQIKPCEGAKILAQKHNEAPFYNETMDVYSLIKSKYKTCLISDTDEIMIKGILENIYFDYEIISEKYQTYKFDKTGKLFKLAIERFNIQPDEMLHIGDGVNDVCGAKIAGADAVWLNRSGKKWNYENKPDYEINNLRELISIVCG